MKEVDIVALTALRPSSLTRDVLFTFRNATNLQKEFMVSLYKNDNKFGVYSFAIIYISIMNPCQICAEISFCTDCSFSCKSSIIFFELMLLYYSF